MFQLNLVFSKQQRSSLHFFFVNENSYLIIKNKMQVDTQSKQSTQLNQLKDRAKQSNPHNVCETSFRLLD